MRKTKRLAAVLLSVLMIVFCFVPSFAATRHYNTYVVLGDSIAAGYMLPGYKYGGKKNAAWHVQEGSYPWHIAKAVGAKKTYQMAHGGYRTSDLRLLLDDSYRGDFINGRRLPSVKGSYELDQPALTKLKKDFRANISKADLITLNIGSNDATQAFAVLYELTENNLTIMQAQAQMGLDPLTNLGTTLENAAKLTENTVMMTRLAALEAEALTGFFSNFDAIVKAIRTLNPHAKLVVMGIYNPVEVMSVANVQFGQLVTPFFEYFNGYMRSGSSFSNQYTYVDMRNIETYIGIGQFDANPDLLMDAHPNLKGHRQMADQVLAVL